MADITPTIKRLILKILGIDTIEESDMIMSGRRIVGKLRSYNNTREIEFRKKLSFFDFNELANPISCSYYHPITENNFYGNAHVLSNKILINAHSRIEHGLYLGSVVPRRNLAKNTKTIITFSNYRKEFIQELTDREVYCVGPYIQYADYLLSLDEISTLKEKLGKILLVFPSHSIDAIHANFDINEFINFIRDHQLKFDTILICLYWKDIMLGHADKYISAGFLVVTAGHIYDYNFLNRLKTIIALSDMTLSNNVGTHIGYCISMNKPHGIFRSAIRYETGSSQQAAQDEINLRSYKDNISMLEAVDDIYRNFSSFQENISQKQIDCINHYWGSINHMD